MPAPSLPIALLLLTFAAPGSAFDIVLDPPSPVPGEILRVEVRGLDNPARIECLFEEESYPFFPVSPGRMRAMIGLTARQKPGDYVLKAIHRRFLLPDVITNVGVTISPREFTHQQITMPAKKTALAARPGAKAGTQNIRGALGGLSKTQKWNGPFVRPTQGRRTSKYGHTRTINKKMSWGWHRGIDVAAASGADVLAPAGGTVVLTGVFPIQGGTMILDHGQGLMSTFYHLHSFNAQTGDVVAAGTRIANVGGGGFSTGSHLHWGTFLHNRAVDPEMLLKRKL